MNEEKRIENKKSDKKALMIFIPVLILSGVIGFLVGGLGNYMEENLADVIAKGIVNLLSTITPYANLVMNAFSITICTIILLHVKKRIVAWDGEDEEVYEKIDGKLSTVLVICNIVFILSYFFFGAGFEYVLGVKEYDAIAMLCYFIGFIIALGANMIIQARVVNLYKEMNPEKQGSVYAFDFSKKWEQSSDEAERIKIYKAAFKSYNFCSTFYIFLWLCCLLGNQIWHYGIMPATIVIIVWLVQFISYQSYAAYYSKHPNKV